MKSLMAVAAACASLALLMAADDSGRRAKFYVPASASALIQQGLASPAPTGAAAAGFQAVEAPSIRTVNNVAQATLAPWITTNAWRFMSGLQKANYDKLPAGAAPEAAAETFTYSAEAILNPNPADLPELGRFLEFAKANDQPSMPAMVNIGVVDDKSPAMEEILNMLTRRNLLFRVVSAPDPKLLTVRLGTKDFPKESADNPSDFAARVREKLTDEKRLIRIYGTSNMIAHLTGDGRHVRLYLLSFTGGRGGGGRAAAGRAGAGRNGKAGAARGGGGGGGFGGGGTGQSPRVRLLGHYRPVKFAGYGAAPDAQLSEVEQTAEATEFTLPAFRVAAVVDLEAGR